MENEKEKRKIEFWTGSMTINEAIARYSPKKPFTKMVKVSVRCTYQAQRITTKQSTQGMKVYAIASCISSLLVEHGYIKAEKQITRIETEKRESRTPGIAFIMQEVE